MGVRVRARGFVGVLLCCVCEGPHKGRRTRPCVCVCVSANILQLRRRLFTFLKSFFAAILLANLES